MNLTQSALASILERSLSTIEKWEAGARVDRLVQEGTWALLLGYSGKRSVRVCFEDSRHDYIMAGEYWSGSSDPDIAAYYIGQRFATSSSSEAVCTAVEISYT